MHFDQFGGAPLHTPQPLKGGQMIDIDHREMVQWGHGKGICGVYEVDGRKEKI